jgi:hypothetical protein
VLRVAAFALLIVAAAETGVIAPLTIDQLASAPTIAVCRVERVTQGPLLPPTPKGDPAGVARRCTATLRVLRAMPSLTVPQISLDEYCAGPNYRGINGHPTYPGLQTGRTYVLPLKIASDRWRLIADEGWGLVVPAIEAEPGGGPPASKHDFIVREIINALMHGSHADRYQFSMFMQFRSAPELDDEIMDRLSTALPDGDPRWLDITTALLSTMGIPRQGSDEFAAGNDPTPIFTFANNRLAARTLRKVPPAQRREGIIREMLEFSAVHVWGTTVTLVPEFKDDPLLLELLPGYIERGQKGALEVACSLVASGNSAFLDETLNAALRVLRASDSDPIEIGSACTLVVRRGSDEQFKEYLRIMKDAKARNKGLYSQMYQIAWTDKSPRIVKILALLLDDERRWSPSSDLRSCDFGGTLLQKVSGVNFGYKEWEKMPQPLRNAALERARAWMNQAFPK